MHQPRAIANEERMHLIHREVVHRLRLCDDRDPLSYAVAAVQCADLIPNDQIPRFDPTSTREVEGICGEFALVKE
jgi:hypothetical protein